MNKPRHKLAETLMDAIGFTEEDLEANREGYLSPAQIAALQQKQTTWLASIGIAVIIAFMVSRFTDWQIISIIAIGGAVFAGYQWLLHFLALKSNQAKAVEGQLRLDVQAGNKKSLFTITIEGQTFNVNKDVFLAFKNNDPYAVYFVPFLNKILSAEWLR